MAWGLGDVRRRWPMVGHEARRELLESVVMVMPCSVCSQDLEVTLAQIAEAQDTLPGHCLAAGRARAPLWRTPAF